MKATTTSYLFILIAFSIWICLSGCTKEDNDQTQDKQEVTLTLNTRLGDPVNTGTASDENTVNTIRAIVFEVNQSNGNVNYIRQIKNQTFAGDEAIKLSFEKCNSVRVFLIANEKSEWELDKTSKTADQIKNTAVIYGDYKQDANIAPAFAMFSESGTLSGQTDNGITMELIRNVAKVSLSLTCNAADVEGLSKGELRLTSIRVEQMAPSAGLGTPYKDISHTSPEDYLSGNTIELIENKNYFIFYNTDQNFKGFETRGLEFYVPEHFVTDTKTYTYIVISGKYIPNGQANGVPVEYVLPLGSDITQKKIEENLLTNSELTLERNNLYEMRASFKSLKEVSEVHVNVTPWNKTEVDGSIDDGRHYLNVSDINFSLDASGGTVLVQFWSNLAPDKIRVLPTGILKENGTSFRVNDIFVSLAHEESAASNLEIIENEKWGHLRLNFQPGTAEAGKTYIITLAAGRIERTISIKAVNETNE